VAGTVANPIGITNPPIDELLATPTPSTAWSSTPPSARADQRLLLPARRGPAGVRRAAGGDRCPGEAAVHRAARDQPGPAHHEQVADPAV
jgi:hypothetical protein